MNRNKKNVYTFLYILSWQMQEMLKCRREMKQWNHNRKHRRKWTNLTKYEQTNQKQKEIKTFNPFDNDNIQEFFFLFAVVFIFHLFLPSTSTHSLSIILLLLFRCKWISIFNFCYSFLLIQCYSCLLLNFKV